MRQVRQTYGWRARGARFRAMGSDSNANTARITDADTARSIWPWTPPPVASVQWDSPSATRARAPFGRSGRTRSRPKSRSAPSSETAPSACAAGTLRFWSAVVKLSFSCARTGDDGRKIARPTAPAVKPLARPNAWAEPSRSDGAAITFEAGSRHRCDARTTALRGLHHVIPTIRPPKSTCVWR